ncbi:response regulator transcription factor [Sphingobacterium hungaricum]|uniref:DNA-binding response regulator n=1 Tax=Sphingobacterium hungaricum TaxID=2082723 RepID=A0A928V0Q4_9SPHI|nr:response regulator transcription factor [Sphingobacterium hungaricum]MBE8714549.1 DNA-binding response regulator [Sphingobacterium hungaricum]
MKVLIIEDEPALRSTMQDFLLNEHFVVELAEDYYSGLTKITNYAYDCILLDIMLPNGSGMDLLKELRAIGKDDSVIILSAKDSVEDKVMGLELGADDYLAKPFHLAELLARIKSTIRRKNVQFDPMIRYKNVSLNTEDRVVYVSDVPINLNRKEFELMRYFMNRPEKLMQKTTLAEAVWGDHIDQADRLDFIYSQIKNLKKKLKDADALVDIQAVYGVGYKLI